MPKGRPSFGSERPCSAPASEVRGSASALSRSRLIGASGRPIHFFNLAHPALHRIERGMGLRLKRRTVREIAGSWINFYHPNEQEGEYWNEAIRRFSAREWEEKIAEMAAIGVDTVIVGATVLRGKSFYPSAIVPERWEHACEDPIEAVLAAADRLGIDVFIGVGLFPGDSGSGQTDPGWRAELPRELHERYGSHRSFHGWHLPQEAVINGYFSDEYIFAANELAGQCRALDERRPVLIAPTGVGTVEDEARFVDQLKTLEVEHIVYRDGIGMRNSDPADLAEIFGKMARIHEKADRPLWASCEIFAFEGATNQSPLVPAPFTRLKTQIEAISPHVRKLLCHQYLGMMNPGSSTAFAGHTSSAALHYDYHEWRCQQAEQGLSGGH